MAERATPTLFRKEALEALQSPDRLDRPLEIVTPASWLPLLTLAALLVLALLWGIFGHIPVTVEAPGLLTYPRRVVPFQAPASGQVVALEVAVGQPVKRGQRLGRIDQPETRQALAQERARLADLKLRHTRLGGLRTQKHDLEKQAIEQKREVLQQRIASTEGMTEVQERLADTLRERKANTERLAERDLVSKVQVLEAQRELIEAEERLQQLENAINDYGAELKALDIQHAGLAQQAAESESGALLEIEESERRIARHEEALHTRGEVISEYDGRVLETAAGAGQIVTEGQRLGSLEAEDPGERLNVVGYFHIQDGKKLAPGMAVRITPSTVQRERHGSILGTITAVSRFPVTLAAVTSVVGNAEIAGELIRQGSKIEAEVTLTTDPKTPSGYRWTSAPGPDLRISVGTTVTLRATVEERRPISYVIPILRQWSGT